MIYRPLLVLFVLWLSVSCNTTNKRGSGGAYPTVGSIERLDARLDQLIPSNAKIEILASGFNWSEGPLWLESEQALLFSDVPENVIYKWTEADSISEYLRPSGYHGTEENKKEPGSNGLILDQEGRLIICQHGNRQVARMRAPLSAPSPDYETLVEDFQGLRFNSPNDIVMSSSGAFYFTDPPYGLDEWNIKELDFQGVYRWQPDGELVLLIDSLTRPNGIGLSPDGHTLYVAVSDPARARYYAYDLDERGLVQSGRMILDVTNMISDTRRGLPDGLAVSKSGHIFASGPGGILVISPEGTLLGSILTGEATSNCAFNQDETILYITADMHLMRIKLTN